jgi:hypothetical protein
MNVNASASGATQIINNGLGDGGLWAGSNITGSKVTFDYSGARVITGTYSIQINNPAQSDVWEFDKGSSQVLTAYDAIIGNANVDKDWGVGDSIAIYGWDGAIVGNQVFLENYINQADFDVDQAFSIPLVDMGLVNGTITALRMELVAKDGGKAPVLYLDDITLAESATQQYIAKPAKGEIVEYQRIELSIQNNVTDIDPDLFLGLALTTGFTLQRFEKDVPQVSLQYRKLSDMLALTWDTGSTITDATKTFLKLVVTLPVPSLLEGDRGDRLVITLGDDFSGLEIMNAILIGKEFVKE